MANIAISDFKDVIIALVFSILGWVAAKVRIWLKFRRFLLAFGKSCSKCEQFVLCVPLWKVIPAPRDVKQFKKVGPDGREYEYFGPDAMLAQQDVDAAASIAALIADFFPQPVKFILDIDKIDWQDKSAALIGAPLSNLRSRAFLADHPHPYFGFEEVRESAEHPAALNIVDNTTQEKYDSAGHREYSVIMRAPNPHSPDRGCLFYIAGAHDTGTMEAANYLRKNWRRFAAKKTDRHAAILFGMHRGDSSTCKIVKEYGFA